MPAVERSEEFFRTLLANSFEGIAIVDAAGMITYQNKAAAEILGAAEGALIGTSAMDLIHPEDVPTAMASLATLNANAGLLLPDDVRMKRQDTGEYLPLETRAMNLSEDPHVAGIVVNFRDVSAQRAAMRALEESEQRLELAVHASELGLWDWDVISDRVAFDGRLAAMLGIEPAELGTTRTDLLTLIHPEDLPSVQDSVQAHLEGATEQLEHEHRLRGKGDTYHWVACRGKIVERNANGAPTRVAGTHLDIDQSQRNAEERHLLEERLQSSQKMESIGQLAGGIAHDFNNILQIVLANACLAKGDVRNTAAVQSALEEIEEAGEKAASLTRQLLAFGRRQTLSQRSCDVNKLIERSLQLLRRVLPESITIDFIPGFKLASAFVDSGQFDQVITNLCVNARDAMPNGGRLTIETENVVINGEYRQKHPWAAAGRYVLVSVSDTGHGMDSDTQKRAFEPFFSTKTHGAGSGLGLAMAHGIVRQHEGLVHLYSERGVGTTIKLFWPSTERPAAAVGPKLDGPVPKGQETVLVVEDEARVRQLAARVLQAAGYTVLTAGDGNEALEVFAQHRARIDLILLDAVMPKRSGKEVYEEISHSSATPVVFTSGYSAASLPAVFLARDDLEVLPKPYSPDLLLRKVRAVLDRARDTGAS